MARLKSACVALSGTQIVGLNKSGSGCPPPAFAKASAGLPALRRLSPRPSSAEANSGRRRPKLPPSCEGGRLHEVRLSSPKSRCSRLTLQRLRTHNAGGSPHTSKYRPWKVVLHLCFQDNQCAAEFERYLKSGSGQAFAKKRFWYPLISGDLKKMRHLSKSRL